MEGGGGGSSSSQILLVSLPQVQIGMEASSEISSSDNNTPSTSTGNLVTPSSSSASVAGKLVCG